MTLRCCTMLLLLAATTAWDEASTPTPSSILSQCVKACDCYEGHKRSANLVVQCRNVNDLPPIFPDRTTSLEIRDAHVPSLRAQLHQQSLRKLHDLDLAGCGVEEVALDAFHGLPELRFVMLANNSIAALSAAHFEHQPHLKLVDVTGNEGLDCTAFRREMKAKWPHAGVKCDGDDMPGDATTGSTTSAVPVPEESEEKLGKEASGLIDDEMLPMTEVPTELDGVDDGVVGIMTLTRDWSFEGPSLEVDGSVFAFIAFAGALGGALGACLVYVAVAVVRSLMKERNQHRCEQAGGEEAAEQDKPLVPSGSLSSIYQSTTIPIGVSAQHAST